MRGRTVKGAAAHSSGRDRTAAAGRRTEPVVVVDIARLLGPLIALKRACKAPDHRMPLSV